MCLLSFPHPATAETYADSAHGDTVDGVNRSGTGYSAGDCAQCHDTYDDTICGVNDLMLFSDVFVNISNQFCTQCHSAVADYQPITTNYPYSYTFGGYPDPYYGHIKKQITDDHSTPDYCGSRHNMKRIRNYIKNDTNGWGFGDDPSPCVACHNPHTAQKNYPPAITEGKLNTAIRRPSHYDSTDPADSLWGDDADERMNDYAGDFTDGVYQAPYYGDNSGTKYEPSGKASPSDGSDLPDYVTFCLDCHQYEQFDPDNNDRTVKAIDYANERHGAYLSNNSSASCCGIQEGTLTAPYVDFENSNYVLSCLDCHEPHGAKKRKHLIRRIINGQEVALDIDSCDQHTDFAEICGKCHEFPQYVDHLKWGGCWDASCHGSGIHGSFHGAKFGYPHGTVTGEPSF